MKIIARGEGDKFFCEITKKELSAILGKDSDDPIHGYVEVRLGETINLSDLIASADWIKNLDNVHLAQVAKDLERVKKSVQKLNFINRLSAEIKPQKSPVDDSDDNIPF